MVLIEKTQSTILLCNPKGTFNATTVENCFILEGAKSKAICVWSPYSIHSTSVMLIDLEIISLYSLGEFLNTLCRSIKMART
mmetsp:Transcript_13542/g.43708  ORF Transcript_13542/g.43708 Transcript_13542/m.43708 type:complete len:82 (-) Transcript_13542:1002-1247(-)